MKRSENNNDIFKTFHEGRFLGALKEAVIALDHTRTGYGIGPLKIKSCNALSSKSFSNENIDFRFETYEVPITENRTSLYQNVPTAFDLRGIFQYGFNMLDAYIKSPDCIPRVKGARSSLAKLLQFVTDIGWHWHLNVCAGIVPPFYSLVKLLHKEGDIVQSQVHLVSEMKNPRPDQHRLKYSKLGTASVGSVLSNAKEGTELTETMAHHLLSKLAVCPTYTLDDFSEGTHGDLRCCCGCAEKTLGVYGDTSMGVPFHWHGRVDILMEIPVTVITEEPDIQCEETKTSAERISARNEQIMAKTVVFSFLQKKKHPDLDNFLIPSIAISKSQVAICLYDSENDVFLLTSLLDLLIGEYIKMETAIVLWLVLNYRYCCSGVPDKILELGLTADFFKQAGPSLEKYVSEVTAPCSFHAENKWSEWPIVTKIKMKRKDNINNINQP